MIKKLSIIFICILLIGATNISFIGFCCPVYTFADEVNALTSDNVEELSIMAYMNSRGGYITSGSITAAIGVAKQYVSSFYASEANTTTIKSSSDLLNHVSITKENDYGISIDSEGITFLNHLVRWLLGQNKFPELYSGGAWGVSSRTSDEVYDGALISGSLFYIMDSTNSEAKSPSGNNIRLDSSYVTVGTPVNGWTADNIKNKVTNGYTNIDLYDFNANTQKIGTFTCVYSQNISITYNTYFFGKGNNGYEAINNFVGNPNSSPNIALSDGWSIIYADRVSAIRGNTAWIIDRNKPNYYYAGVVAYNYSSGKYYFRLEQSYNRNNVTSSDCTVDFDTDNFEKEDTDNTEQITYTPSFSNDGGNTYNTYNTNNYTEQTFIDTYIDDYINKRTVINNEQVEPDPEPEEPGGVVPDWSGNGGSGTITPDGNGGYTFNLPDFELPDLDIDWKISGLSEKFPFSIPFDLIAFFTVLNAEPVTPELQAEIPLGRYSWEIDWSMDQFEPLAIILRNLEFIGFCIGLALITRHIIKG